MCEGQWSVAYYQDRMMADGFTDIFLKYSHKL